MRTIERHDGRRQDDSSAKATVRRAHERTVERRRRAVLKDAEVLACEAAWVALFLSKIGLFDVRRSDPRRRGAEHVFIFVGPRDDGVIEGAEVPPSRAEANDGGARMRGRHRGCGGVNLVRVLAFGTSECPLASLVLPDEVGAPSGRCGDGRGHDANPTRQVHKLDDVASDAVSDPEKREPMIDDADSLRGLFLQAAQDHREVSFARRNGVVAEKGKERPELVERQGSRSVTGSLDGSA